MQQFKQICKFQTLISWDAPTAPMGKSLQFSYYVFIYQKEAKEQKSD